MNKQTETVRFDTGCIGCILGKFLNAVPSGTDEVARLRYAKRILGIIAAADNTVTAPEIVAECTALKNESFGEADDFADVKAYFNSLMLTLEPYITEKIRKSDNPMRLALSYALLGNYIDFGAMDNVDEGKLKSLIDNAEGIDVDTGELSRLISELLSAERLVYITDNCGEIVFDKVFIKEIRSLFPRLSVTVLVRGENVLNDATLADAESVGLCDTADVLSNGTGIAGTCIDKVPSDIKRLLLSADVIISKGQGNFETLCYSGMNIYYLFLCKCKLFADRFGVERLSPMLLNDLRMKR